MTSRTPTRTGSRRLKLACALAGLLVACGEVAPSAVADPGCATPSEFILSPSQSLDLLSDRSAFDRSSQFAAADSQEIRQSAEQILSSPEFRHFKRLEPGESPLGRRPGGGSSGSGRSGGSGGTSGKSDGAGSGEAESDESSPTSSSPSGGATSAPSSTSMPSLGLSAALGTFMTVLAWILLLAVAAVIVFLIVMAVKNYDAGTQSSELTGNGELQGEIEPERPPGELPADAYLAEARRLATAGNYREAIAQLLLGAMSYAERAGLIRYRRGLTQRDYLRTLRGEKSQYQAMRTLVRVYEPLGFGRRTPERQHFEESLAGYERAFRAVPHGREQASAGRKPA